MPLGTHLLLAATVLCCFATILAFPFPDTNQCRCLKTTNVQMNPRQFRRIEILPAGVSCHKTEIIITKNNQSKVCVNPEAKWIQAIVSQLVKSQKKKRNV